MTNVLLVEDHASFRQALGIVLDLEPDLTVTAQLDRVDLTTLAAAAAGVDVAIIDLDLPGVDGVEVVTHLRRLPDPPGCVVLTGLLDDRELGRAIEAGASAVLHKSTAMPEVIAAVRTVAAGGTVLPASDTSRRLQALARDRERRWHASLLAERITAREREILEHLVFGLGNADIAARLGISPETVQTHIRNLLSKLGASSRLEAVSLALQHGLVDPP